MAPRTSPVLRRKIRGKATAAVGSKPALAGAAKKKPDTGRPFRVDAGDLPQLAGKDWDKLVAAARKELGLDEAELGWSLEETARRLGKMRPTEDQIVGTFIEVVAAVSKPVRSTRLGMVRACLAIQLRDMLRGDRNFFSNKAKGEGALASVVDSDAFALGIADLPLTDAQRKEALTRIPKRTPGLSAKDWDKAWEAALDAEVERLMELVQAKVIHARDTEIGKSEFVDRAVLLPLADGRLVLLVSEEYKAPKSGGGGRQTSMRINRLFNGDIAPDTAFSFTPASSGTISQQMLGAGKDADPVRTTMGQLIITSSTRGADQVLVKASASGNNDLQIATQRRSRKLVEGKREYGESLRAGKTVDVTYFKQRFSMPGRELRNVVKRLRKPRR